MAQRKLSQGFPICLALAEPPQSSRIESVLAQDGYDVLAFSSASELWKNFGWRQPRYIITDRRFPDGYSALDLCRDVRARYMLPYVYIHVLGRANSITEIEQVLEAGANDYSVKPITPSQLRARLRVGLRWLNYIDSLTTPATDVRAST
jgi:DNA-binding response OmpR family regulator